jgi:hypothetical protein
MNQLLELNKRVVNNLNYKLELLIKKKTIALKWIVFIIIFCLFYLIKLK